MKKSSFSKVKGLELVTLLKLNFFIGIFQGFYYEFYMTTFRTATFKNNSFQNTYTMGDS